MTTVDLLQHYPPHKESLHHEKAPGKTEASNSKKPDSTIPDPGPSQVFDAKTKLLYDMLDGVVKDLASRQPEPTSEWEGTFWRHPWQERPRSPAYSEISDSFEMSSKIEHCTNVLLSTPMSPASAHFKGPDGWPLGIEVAMNDFHRGRLSTSVLQEKELPNPLKLRKQKQQTPRIGGNDNGVRQETAGCESTPSEQHGEGQHVQDSVSLKPRAFQKEQSSVLFRQYGQRQDHLGSASLELEQESYTYPQQQNDCQYQHESEDMNPSELEQQNDEETDSDLIVACIPTLSGRKYGDDQSLPGNASSEPHPTLVHGNVPIGPALINASHELLVLPFHSEKHGDSLTQVDGTCLPDENCPQTTLCDSSPHKQETQDDAHQAEPRINALADAPDEESDSSKVLGALEGTEVEGVDLETGRQNTFENSENDTIHGVGPLTSEDNKTDIESDFFSWKTLDPLDDILEESEDSCEDSSTRTSTLDQGKPQHSTPRSAEPLDSQKPSGAGERRDSMLTLQLPKTEPSNLLSSPQGVPPTVKLTTTPSSKPQIEPSEHRPNDSEFAASTLSAATMAELKDPARRHGLLSASALAEMRKTAESQPHFQTGPNSPTDQSQADIHPLLRSKSFSRPSSQASKIVNDSLLKYVFKNDDSEGHELSHQVTIKPHSLFQPEPQNAESFLTQTSRSDNPSSQLDKTMDYRVPKYLSHVDYMEGHEVEYAGTFTSQRSTLRSSNDSTLVSSFQSAAPSSKFLPSTSPSTTSRLSASAVGSPDLMPSSISKPSISPSTSACYSNSTIETPTAYNSWASTPYERDHGNTASTPSTLPTSTVPTPNTSFHINSPTCRGMTMTPSSSFGQIAGNCYSSPGIPITPSSSFGNSTGNRSYRRSVSTSNMVARYHRARYPDLPTAAMADSVPSSKEPNEENHNREVTADPFTTTHETTTPVSLKIKAPSKEDLASTLTVSADPFNTPTKRSPNRFSLHRRSIDERVLSSKIFGPHRSRFHKRSTSASIDTTTKPDDSRTGHKRSLSIATATVEQKWEMAPPPTPLGLRDTFSMRYRPEPLEADDHYSPRKDSFQGIKQGLKKVFGRK